MMDSFTISRRAKADEISLICNISHDPNAITTTSRFPLLFRIRLAFENENVKRLSFRFQPVSFPMSDDTNYMVQTIMEKLAANKTLKSFRWNMDLSHELYLRQLTYTISTNVHLRELDLSGSSFGAIDDRLLRQFCYAVAAHPQLVSLSLADCNLTGDQARLVVERLDGCWLEKLNMRGNELDPIRNQISKFIYAHPITDLDLSEGEFVGFSSGLSFIFYPAETSRALRKLWLEGCGIETLTFNLDIVNFLIHSQCRLEFLSVRNNKIDWLYEFFQKLPRMKTIRYLDFANNSPTVSCYGLHDTILSNYSLGWINTGGFDFIQEAEFVIHRMDLNNAGIGLTHDESIPISLWPIILARINFLLFRGFQNAQYWKKFPRPKTIFKYDNWSPSKTYYFTNERRSTTMFEMIRASPPALFDLNRPWII